MSKPVKNVALCKACGVPLWCPTCEHDAEDKRMREPDSDNGKCFHFGWIEVWPAYSDEPFYPPDTYLSLAAMKQLVLDANAAIEWYERRQADSEEGR